MNKLHLYTGDGKGKTTAAMGMALRCLGHGKRVLVGQFIKDGRSGELTALGQLPDAVVMPCPPMQGFTFTMTEAEHAATASAQGAYLHELCRRIAEVKPACIVLDELAMAVPLGMISPEDAQQLIDTALAHGETIVTGYYAPAWLRDRADYVTCMQSEKHPYQTENLPAREGVEW